MLSETVHYVLLATLAIALVIGAFTDMRSRRIPNWLTAAIALGAPLFWWASGIPLWPDIAIQIGLAVLVLAVCLGMYAMRWMGGGDVKLLAALALWIMPRWYLDLLIMMALVGGVLTLIVGGWHVMRRKKDKIKIPYGFAH